MCSAALWEAARAGHTGLWVDLKAIPIRQEVVELCDFVDVNPYKIPSAWAHLLIGFGTRGPAGRDIKAPGHPGGGDRNQFTPGNDRVVMPMMTRCAIWSRPQAWSCREGDRPGKGRVFRPDDDWPDEWPQQKIWKEG